MMEISDISFGIGIVNGISEIQNDDSLSGYSFLADEFHITSAGHLITPKNGLSFGVLFRLSDPELQEIAYYKEVVTYPKMINPNTRIESTGWSEVVIGSNNDRNFTFFTFEFEWEFVSGEWVFEYLTLDETPLAKVCFHVK